MQQLLGPLNGFPMGKKRTAKNHPSQLRFGVKTADDMRKDADTIKGLVTYLLEVERDMRAKGRKELRIDGVTKVDRATAMLRDYVHNVEIALLHQKYDD